MQAPARSVMFFGSTKLEIARVHTSHVMSTPNHKRTRPKEKKPKKGKKIIISQKQHTTKASKPASAQILSAAWIAEGSLALLFFFLLFFLFLSPPSPVGLTLQTWPYTRSLAPACWDRVLVRNMNMELVAGLSIASTELWLTQADQGGGGNGKEMPCHNKGRQERHQNSQMSYRVFLCLPVLGALKCVVLGRSRKQQPHPPIDPARTSILVRDLPSLNHTFSLYTIFHYSHSLFQISPSIFFFILSRFWTNRMSAPLYPCPFCRLLLDPLVRLSHVPILPPTQPTYASPFLPFKIPPQTQF